MKAHTLWVHHTSYSSVTSAATSIQSLTLSHRKNRKAIEMTVKRFLTCDLWLMTLNYEFDLDILPLDLYVKNPNFCKYLRPGVWDGSWWDGRCQNYYTRHESSEMLGVPITRRNFRIFYMISQGNWICQILFISHYLEPNPISSKVLTRQTILASIKTEKCPH